jgi:hypothetical protein
LFYLFSGLFLGGLNDENDVLGAVATVLFVVVEDPFFINVCQLDTLV